MKLLCPKCKKILIKDQNSYKCINNHNYDISKNGYLNLNLTNSKKISGDNKMMIDARISTLEKGYYNHLMNYLNTIIKDLNVKNCVDLACGSGYYTKNFTPLNKVGIDLSKAAINYACKKDKVTQYIIASIFDIPLQSDSYDLATLLFAPIPTTEIERILKINGYLITVTPAKNHLHELKAILYDKPEQNTDNQIDTILKLVKSYNLEKEICINSNTDLLNLFMMTPYYYKTSISDKKKLDKINSLNLTTSFIIKVYKKII
ncbi:MAG: putative RNA methyltransferase [Anaerorhabdus sp.]